MAMLRFSKLRDISPRVLAFYKAEIIQAFILELL